MEEISHTFVYNEDVIFKINNQLNNYFINRTLKINPHYSGEYNFIFTKHQLDLHLDSLKKNIDVNKPYHVLEESYQNGVSLINLMVNTQIPIFNRNRLRYMCKDKDYEIIEERWEMNTTKYDQFALEHLQPILFKYGITHVVFTWNLNCLSYKNDNLKNKPILYWYDSKNKKEWIEFNYPD